VLPLEPCKSKRLVESMQNSFCGLKAAVVPFSANFSDAWRDCSMRLASAGNERAKKAHLGASLNGWHSSAKQRLMMSVEALSYGFLNFFAQGWN
jgi:hypothetical protein